MIDMTTDRVTIEVPKCKSYLNELYIIPPEADILEHDVSLLHKGNHRDPFSVLGSKIVDTKEFGKCVVFRIWYMNVQKVQVKVNNLEYTDCIKRCDWLFQKCFQLNNSTLTEFNYILKITNEHGLEFKTEDIFSYNLLLPHDDLVKFQSGSYWHVDNLMGCHYMTYGLSFGFRFSVWAPGAHCVSVVGNFNNWDGRAHPMRLRTEFGVWELFLPSTALEDLDTDQNTERLRYGPQFGHTYGYKIHTSTQTDIIKIDAYAQEFEQPPAYASVISRCDDAYRTKPFVWGDDDWMSSRVDGDMHRKPMSIYEVHLPSWRRGNDNSYLSYRELAHRLIEHAKNLNFTHVEFLPLTQHPFEGSWGYQVSGLYAPYSRLGSADDLKYLINELHKAGLGVFLDLVIAHFVKDDWGIVNYDGGPCYEYSDSREGEHKQWGTAVFNFGRSEVKTFLLGSAYHWLSRYHVDGLRIDAVTSMLFKNHMRKAGEWIPNEFGGDTNIQAIQLLKELNWVIHENYPGVYVTAEESTDYKGVTGVDGLGFDAKWDLGWMNDTLKYLLKPDRSKVHNLLTFRGLYVNHENWILPLSHDEVVNGKGNLLDKCGGLCVPFSDRLCQLRALYGFQVGVPGRPLLFMGAEFAQGREWKEYRSIDWHEADEYLRSKCCVWVSDLLNVYKYHVALHMGDNEPLLNFQWVDCENASDNILAFLRKWQEWHNDILVILNFSNNNYYRYPIGVPHGGYWKVLLNSQDPRYGGNGFGMSNLSRLSSTQGGKIGWAYCLWIDIPKYSCLFLQPPQPEITDTDINNHKCESSNFLINS